MYILCIEEIQYIYFHVYVQLFLYVHSYLCIDVSAHIYKYTHICDADNSSKSRGDLIYIYFMSMYIHMCMYIRICVLMYLHISINIHTSAMPTTAANHGEI